MAVFSLMVSMGFTEVAWASSVTECLKSVQDQVNASRRRSAPEAVRAIEAPKSSESKVTDLLNGTPAPQFQDIHIVIVSDCSTHQKWMIYIFFHSASMVGQTGPITWVRANCALRGKPNATAYDIALLKSLYAEANLMDVEVNEKLPDASWIKPLAFQRFLDTQVDMPGSTLVSLTDGDMIFLSRFRIDDLEERGIPFQGRKRLIRENGKLIGPTLGIAQRYLCCDNSGPPYIFWLSTWRKLLPLWNMKRKEAKGNWGEEQMGFAYAIKVAGLRFNIFEHFTLSDPEGIGEGWPWVDVAISKPGGDICASGLLGEQGDVQKLPTFLHVVRPWRVDDTWRYSKYQVPPCWSHPEGTDGILECAMPLLAEPPLDLMAKAAAKSKRTAWTLCTIYHNFNSMLLKHKRVRCPKGFNGARILRIGDQWANFLTQDAAPTVTGGVPPKWVDRCARQCNCAPWKK
eukprot:TRINITY_DN31093_c0_g1_i1.p1 TRINITY_DN31093_c0_g1~~TRINITY_DN31093_c0_g1_i1.p1  ORF type:complete len:513 (-),score=57.11 TRINITY_DN31093_c0_g1_i1:210-1583(-)